MKVDIYIKERNGSREIRIPILPEQIRVVTGEADFISYDIINVGEVAVPSGVGLAAYSWESEFPGEYRLDSKGRYSVGDSLLRGDWQDPSVYHNTLKDWKEKGTLLNLLVTGFPINTDVYLQSYDANPSGGFGDMSYEISFIQARNLTVNVVKTPVKRTTKKTTTYTVKKGDTLWGISERYIGEGESWTSIYDANSKIIEQTAKKYNYKSSNHGWWIFPGTKITIPSNTISQKAATD